MPIFKVKILFWPFLLLTGMSKGHVIVFNYQIHLQMSRDYFQASNGILTVTGLFLLLG